MLGRPALAAVRRRRLRCAHRRSTRVLDEVVPFLEAPPLAADQSEIVRSAVGLAADARRSSSTASARSSASLKYGAHGLPLIGSGDWNDGMNRVGHDGRGESVWLGWFLVVVLNDIAPICDERGDAGSRAALSHRGAVAHRHAGARLGRQLVSARLFRRWHAARIGAERRVPDRFADAIVGGALGRGAAAARRARDGRGARAPRAARRAGWCCS